jgi:hypothetical protein
VTCDWCSCMYGLCSSSCCSIAAPCMHSTQCWHGICDITAIC